MSEDTRSEGQDGPNTFDRLLAEVAAAPDVEPALRLDPGDKVNDRFVIEGELGQGGMGRVYLARDVQLERQVAIKLHAGLATSAALDRLLDEARAMAALSHPNVVTVHEVGTISGQLYIAMEHMPGGSLRDLLSTYPPLDEVLARFVEAGRGLEAAHRAGLIHRDFKPDNILIAGDGRACVADFGLARPEGDARGLAKGSPRSLAKTTGSAGTPAYMAPEQLRGTSVDARSDQFSFCVALWEAVTGKLPFHGIPTDEIRKKTPDELEAALEAALENWPSLPARVPARVRRVLGRGVSVEPAERYESMTALLADLAPKNTALPVIIAASLLTVAIIALIVSVTRDNNAGVSCSSEDARLDAIWSAEREQAIETSFANTRLPYASHAAEAIATAVPGQLAAIRDQRDRSCREARISGFMSDANYERSLACLSQQRDRLEAQVKLWVAADAEVVAATDDVIRAMLPATVCGDPRHLNARSPAPARAIAADVARIERAIGAADVASQNGKLELAHGQMQTALESARGLDYDPLLATALLYAGVVARRRQEADAAIALLKEGLLVAERADVDETRTRILLYLAMTLAVNKADAEAAELFQKLADAKIKKESNPWLRFLALDLLGAMTDFQGKYDDALGYRQAAFDVARSELSGSPSTMAQAEANLGLSWHAVGKLQSAVESYTRALDLLEDEVGPFHPKLARLLDNAGLANGELGNTEVAVAQLSRGLDIARRVYGERAVEVGYSLLNLGVAFSHAGEDRLAIEQYLKALDIVSAAVGEKHPDVALVLNSLGVAHEGLDEFDKALVWHRKALEVTRAQDENHPNVALVIANIGAVELEAGAARAAVASLKDAVRRQEAIDKTSANLIFPLTLLGRALLETGDAADALTALERAHALLDAGEQSTAQIARTKFALARALVAARRDRIRAARLATDARVAFVSAGVDVYAKRIADVDAWLARYAPPMR